MDRAREHISGYGLPQKAWGKQSGVILFSEWLYGDQAEDWAWITLHSLAQTFLKDLQWA